MQKKRPRREDGRQKSEATGGGRTPGAASGTDTTAAAGKPAAGIRDTGELGARTRAGGVETAGAAETFDGVDALGAADAVTPDAAFPASAGAPAAGTRPGASYPVPPSPAVRGARTVRGASGAARHAAPSSPTGTAASPAVSPDAASGAETAVSPAPAATASHPAPAAPATASPAVETGAAPATEPGTLQSAEAGTTAPAAAGAPRTTQAGASAPRATGEPPSTERGGPPSEPRRTASMAPGRQASEPGRSSSPESGASPDSPEPDSPEPPEPAAPAAPGTPEPGDGAGTPSSVKAGAAGSPVGKGRRARVRSRLVVAVAVVAAATAAASAPGMIAAAGRVSDTQALVTDAERTGQALTLAHALADERDALTAYAAAERPDGRNSAKALPADRRTPVDRQIAELRPDAPPALRHDLDRVAAVRSAALTGDSDALHVHESYAGIILALHHLAEDLAERTPPRAGSGAHALADLDSAVQQAEAARGLLLAALAVPAATETSTVIDPATGLPRTVHTEPPANKRNRDGLSTAAQQANLREQAALADFHDRAPAAHRSAYDTTVTGPGVTTAERDLARLTDRATLSDDDRETDRAKLESELTARIDLMRGAEASLNVTRTKDLSRLRDDDVTALEIRAALAGACLLAAVGVVMAMSRSLTRPLAVLRLGSARLVADPETADPIRFTGRNDEFAQVVRSVNALHRHAAALRERLRAISGQGAEPAAATAATDQAAAADLGQVLAERRRARTRHASDHRPAPETAAPAPRPRAEASAGERTGDQAGARADERAGAQPGMRAADGTAGAAVPDAAAGDAASGAADGGHGTVVHLALRTLGLVERQLAVIENLEDQEDDPDRLATLFRLDHFATVMRRHSENLLVLAGADRTHQHPGPVPLVDVVRAAASEVERYERVRIAALPPHTHVVGHAADDLSHLLAELLENATSFSPPDAAVEVSGWLLESGDLMLSVVDGGIGMSAERLAEANARLAHHASETARPASPDTAPFPADGAPDAAQPTADAAGGSGEAEGFGLGLYVVARLARRHGARVRLREQKQGGVAAAVLLPHAALAAGADAPAMPGQARPVGGTPQVGLPGAVAEANSNRLPGRGPATLPTPSAQAGQVEADEPADAAEPHGPAAAQAGQARGRHRAAPHARADTGAAPPAGNPYAIGPDRHERADGTAGESSVSPAPGTDDRGAPVWDRVTDKGLPKRTPRVSAAGSVPAPRAGGVDAEELRRRLGGFQHGARVGHREAARTRDRSAGVPGGQDTAAAGVRGAEQTGAGESARPAGSVDGERPARSAEEAVAHVEVAGRVAGLGGAAEVQDVKGDTVEEASS